jgi:hypothetical protein
LSEHPLCCDCLSCLPGWPATGTGYVVPSLERERQRYERRLAIRRARYRVARLKLRLAPIEAARFARRERTAA